MLEGGLRAAEICVLNDQDLGHDAEREPLLRIHGKGRKERLVPVQALVAAAIHAYLLATGRRVGTPEAILEFGQVVVQMGLLGLTSHARDVVLQVSQDRTHQRKGGMPEERQPRGMTCESSLNASPSRNL